MSRHAHIALAILEKRKAALAPAPEADLLSDEDLADDILGDELFDDEETDDGTADPKEARREMLSSIMKNLRDTRDN